MHQIIKYIGYPGLRSVFFLIIFLGSGRGIAHGEMDHWFFGIGTGLHFSSGTPQVLARSDKNSVEACASISDSLGNLLFYAQANKVFNPNHQVMVNGNLLELSRQYSNNATQGVGIVPMPGDTDKYYVFSMRYIGDRYGLDYAIVKMIKQFNRGEVIERC